MVYVRPINPAGPPAPFSSSMSGADRLERVSVRIRSGVWEVADTV